MERHYPLQVIRYADVTQDGALKFAAAGPTSRRNGNVLPGKNVQAGHLLAGVTRSEPGPWLSWPSHEHAEMLEELYV